MNKAFDEILDNLNQVPNEFRHEEYNEAIRDVVRFIERYKEEYNNGWIPCSERLPEYAESLVNCTIKRLSDGHVLVQNLIYNRIDNKWKWIDYPEDICVDTDSFTILSWQPLPEPYKEGE